MRSRRDSVRYRLVDRKHAAGACSQKEEGAGIDRTPSGSEGFYYELYKESATSKLW